MQEFIIIQTPQQQNSYPNPYDLGKKVSLRDVELYNKNPQMADFYNKLRVVNKRELIRVDVAMQEQWVENRTNPEVVI